MVLPFVSTDTQTQYDMKKERKNVKVADIMLNEGQVQWLPKNPRQWTREDLDRTKKSLEEDADFLEDRPILLIEHEGKYVTFAGNLRTSAAKELGMKNVPCVIYVHEDDADRETIKRRAIKDDGSFGTWDFDVLANEWDGLPLADWGVPAWNTEESDTTEPNEPKDISDQIQNEYKVEVTCVNEAEQEQLYNKLIGEGYECRILTL